MLSLVPRFRISGLAASAIVLAIGICGSLYAVYRIERGLWRAAEQSFTQDAGKLCTAVEERINLFSYGLHGARGIFAASDHVTRDEFRAYMQSRYMAKEFPGACGFGFIQRVPHDQLHDFATSARGEMSDFCLRNPRAAQHYDIVLYLEPQPPNVQAVGFDISADPIARHAFERAMLSAEPSMTARAVSLPGRTGRSTFLMMLPVYAKHMPTTTPTERRAAFTGCVFATFAIDGVLRGVANVVDNRVAFELFDASPATESLLLGQTTESDRVSGRTFQQAKQFLVGGRLLTMQMHASPASYKDTQDCLPLVVGLGGGIGSLLFAAFVWLLGNSREQALEQAAIMTAGYRESEARARAATAAAERSLAELACHKYALDQHAIVAITDAEGSLIYVNDKFCQTSGYAREELIGKNHRIMNSGHHAPEFWNKMWATVSRGEVWKGEVCNRAKDGSLYWVEGTIVPLHDAEGQIIQYVSIRTDISDRKRAEAALRNYIHQLEEARVGIEEKTLELQYQAVELKQASERADAANAAKSQFLANMSHEIRTPLTAILGYAELLAEREPNTGLSHAEIADTIRTAGEHLLTIINDILDLSKIEAGKMKIEHIETSLPSILKEIASLLGPRAAEKGVAFQTRQLTPLPKVMISDPTRLRQILVNLAGNAVKFTEAGSITISASLHDTEAGRRVRIDVEDTGAGMTPDQADRLFMPFTQADATVTRKHGGTGLGLTICRRLAQLMNGEIDLLHTAPGVGTCFRLELPCMIPAGTKFVTESVVTSVPTSGDSLPKLTGKILLAEDGPENQRLISLLLCRAGATVAIADNGRIALEMLMHASFNGEPFDLLLTDMQMPEMDGYTLVQTLRMQGNTMPILAVTANTMTEDERKCRAAGCDAYVSKPIDKACLIHACAELLYRTPSVCQA